MNANATLLQTRNCWSYLLILVFLGITGCAGVGSVIPLERQIPLVEAEKNHGSFKYGQLTLKYSYKLAGGSKILAGSNMILAGQASYNESVDSLDIRILFLDAAGTVLQQKVVFSSGYRTGDSRISDRVFQKTLVVPPESAAISFTSYAQTRNSHR